MIVFFITGVVFADGAKTLPYLLDVLFGSQPICATVPDGFARGGTRPFQESHCSSASGNTFVLAVMASAGALVDVAPLSICSFFVFFTAVCLLHTSCFLRKVPCRYLIFRGNSIIINSNSHFCSPSVMDLVNTMPP